MRARLRALAELPPSLDTERSSPAVRTDDRRVIAALRRRCGPKRRPLAREAELADRRLQAILAERTRMAKPQTERGLANRHHRSPRSPRSKARSAPNSTMRLACRGKAPRADQRNRSGRKRPPRCPDATSASAENADGGTTRRRREIRWRRYRARARLPPAPKSAWMAPSAPHRHRARNPRHAGSRAHAVAGLAEISRARNCRHLTRSRKSRKAAPRPRAARRVNLRAEEELREVEAQHTSLTTERDDLVEASSGCARHPEPQREARERLLTSFETVNGHFKRLFVELFGGGEAALHLIESDDPLEAGLEIIAKPPGKNRNAVAVVRRRAGADPRWR